MVEPPDYRTALHPFKCLRPKVPVGFNTFESTVVYGQLRSVHGPAERAKITWM